MVYKIRRKSDGLYSIGGTNPKFDPIGKYWNTELYVKNHIRGIESKIYDDCELVGVEVSQKIISTPIDIPAYINLCISSYVDSGGDRKIPLVALSQRPEWI